MLTNITKGLAVGAVAAMLSLVSPSPSEAQSSSDTLRVGNYGGAFTRAQRKFSGELFTKRTGIKVEYINANPGNHLAKMIAGKGREAPYDVVYLDDDIQALAIQAGVLDKIDPSKLSNLRHIFKEAQNAKGYGPGIIFVTVGIAYNKEKFKAAGIPEPTSWKDLWDPRLAGKVAVPEISRIDGKCFLIATARLLGGGEADLERGIDEIAKLKAHSYFSSSAQAQGLMSSGDAWAAIMVGGRVWDLIDKGHPLGFLYPREKGFGGLTTVDVVSGTKMSKEAHAYIDAVLDPLPQLGQAYEVPYGPTNKVLAPVIAAYPNLAKKFVSTPKQLEALYLPDWIEYYKHHEKMSDLWNRRVIK